LNHFLKLTFKCSSKTTGNLLQVNGGGEEGGGGGLKALEGREENTQLDASQGGHKWKWNSPHFFLQSLLVLVNHRHFLHIGG